MLESLAIRERPGLEAARQDIGNIADLVTSLVFHDILQQARQIDCHLFKVYASGKRARSISCETRGQALLDLGASLPPDRPGLLPRCASPLASPSQPTFAPSTLLLHGFSPVTLAFGHIVGRVHADAASAVHGRIGGRPVPQKASPVRRSLKGAGGPRAHLSIKGPAG